MTKASGSYRIHFREPLTAKLQPLEIVCAGYSIDNGAIKMVEAYVWPQGNPYQPEDTLIISLQHYGFVIINPDRS